MEIPENNTRWLVRRALDEKRLFVIASVLTVLSAACFVLFSWFLSKFAATWLASDEIIPQSLLIALAFLAGRYLFAHFASLMNYRAGSTIVSKIKRSLYPRLLHQNQSDAVESTLLVTRVSDDLKPFFTFFIPSAIASALVSILLLAVSFSFEVWVGVILIFSVSIIMFLMRMIGVGAASLHKSHINLFVKYSAVFYNRLQTIAEIVNLNNLDSQYGFLSKKSKELNSATTSVMRVAILSSAVLELFVSIAIAGVAIFLGLRLLGIMSGRHYGETYDFHIALFLLTITPYFFFYIRKFVSAYHDKNKALASAQLLIPILNIEDEDSIEVVEEPLKSIEINELSFAYPNALVKVLHDIHLTMPEKGLVLVKGISGSGKSTLLKILSGNLTGQEGSISVNGHDNLWSEQWLRENSSYMNQFPFIFDGTLQYNVFLEQDTFGEDHSPDFLNKILVKKEEGWQTVLSHNGKQLSGGEKQLVTLARMILHPKPVAIMDEPTSSLDGDTAEIIIEQIEKLSRERLVILASHDEKFEEIATQVLNLNWGEQMHYA